MLTILLATGLVAMASAAEDQHSFLRRQGERVLKKSLGPTSRCPSLKEETCDIPSVMKCEFGELECDGVIIGPEEVNCSCVDGAWSCPVKAVCATVTDYVCPLDQPAPGSSCEGVMDCPYGEVDCNGSTIPQYMFSCWDGVWMFAEPLCEG
jgi:hypothetical protein